MARKSILRKLGVWPFLVLFALLYSGRESMGLTDISDLNSLSEGILPVALVLMLLALIWCASSMRKRSKRSNKV